MADHHHHHQHRPNRISLPSRSNIPAAGAAATPTPRIYPIFPYAPSTPTPTPSKHRFSISRPSSSTGSSVSFLFLLLFSLRSLYSLLPFLRASSPSFSVFPFAFIVSLLSFGLTLSFSLFASFFGKQKSQRPIFSLTLITQSQHKLLVAKSLLLAVVFLLRFQALRYCGTAAMILAELSGNMAARYMGEGKNRRFIGRSQIGSSKVRGFIALFSGLILLSVSWDRIECFPWSHVNIRSKGFLAFPSENCLRIWPMLLPFLSGFLGCYERVLLNWGEIRELGQKRVRLITLFFTTTVLFIPAAVSMLVFEAEGDSISVSSLGWPLANTVVFGVLLSESYTDDKVGAPKDIQKEYFVTFVCTLVLELFYYPELSLWGLLICGLLLWVSVRELNPIYINYPELGLESCETFSTAVMKPIRHILSERKSRKIALFLLINTAYMVVEFVAGFMSNSLGLISDACHMLFDCAALAIGLYASYISRLPANGQFNYGRGRFEVLSGYVNAVFLVLVGALITLESFERILDPQEISTGSLLAVSVGGLAVNMVGLVFFHEEHHHAHGGSGACSHSHSHSHTHLEADSHDHDHHQDHDHHSHSHTHLEVHSHSHNHEHDHDHHSHSHTHLEAHSHSHKHNHDHDHHSHSHTHLEAHSHPHNHDHDHHLHQHAGKLDEIRQEHITVVHDCNKKSCSNHDHHCNTDHERHKHKHSHETYSKGEHEITQFQSNGHDHHHNHQECDQHNHDFQHVDPQNHNHDHDHHPHNHVNQYDHNHSHTDQLLVIKDKKKHHHHHVDHNMQGIFLHVLADTLGSVGVVISTLLIKFKGWLVADPACSIFISALIVSSVIPLLRNSAEILLQRVPRSCEQDLKESINEVMNLKGVFGIQNLHVWNFTNSDIVGTLHLHVSADADKASIRKQVSHILHDSGIKDLEMQVECVNYN